MHICVEVEGLRRVGGDKIPGEGTKLVSVKEPILFHTNNYI